MSSGAGRSRRSGHPPPRLCRIVLGKRPGALAHLLDRQLDAPVDVRLLHVFVVGPGLLAGGRDRVRQVPEQLPDDVQGRAGVDPAVPAVLDPVAGWIAWSWDWPAIGIAS